MAGKTARKAADKKQAGEGAADERSETKRSNKDAGGECAYSKAEVAEIFCRFKAATPNPRSELHYANAYTLLVAVVLSAQATDVGVNRATAELFKQVDSPAKMLALGEEKLGEYIRTIGLWRNKAKNIIGLSALLAEKFNGQVPSSREALMSLPGVGRKSANVVLNVVFGQPTMAVDTHIFRVGNRIGLACGATPEAVEQALLKIVPPAYAHDAHHWLVLHGRYVCKARKPLCDKCIIADLCKAAVKTCAAAAPLNVYRAALQPMNERSE